MGHGVGRLGALINMGLMEELDPWPVASECLYVTVYLLFVSFWFFLNIHQVVLKVPACLVCTKGKPGSDGGVPSLWGTVVVTTGSAGSPWGHRDREKCHF